MFSCCLQTVFLFTRVKEIWTRNSSVNLKTFLNFDPKGFHCCCQNCFCRRPEWWFGGDVSGWWSSELILRCTEKTWAPKIHRSKLVFLTLKKIVFTDVKIVFTSVHGNIFERKPNLRKLSKYTFATSLSKMCLPVALKTKIYASIEKLSQKYMDEPKCFPERWVKGFCLVLSKLLV